MRWCWSTSCGRCSASSSRSPCPSACTRPRRTSTAPASPVPRCRTASRWRDRVPPDCLPTMPPCRCARSPEEPRDVNVFWFLPTHGDGRYLGTAQGARPVSLSYLRQVAQAADNLGYYGVLIPTGRSCEDSWVVASALAPLTERLRYLVAIRPGIISPTVSARMAATLDRLSNGRLLINVVTGGDPDENRGDGLHLDHDQRYEAADEFLRIWRRVLQGESVDFEGRHLHVENAKALYPPVQKPYPPLYFGGSSEAAHALAASQVDVYLTWGEPPAAVAAKIADVRERAARQGRTVRFGIRLH